MELTEEYWLCELMALGAAQLTGIVERALTPLESEERGMRSCMVATSLTYTSWLLSPSDDGVGEAAVRLLKELVLLDGRVSPAANSLRSYLYLPLNYLLLKHDCRNLYQLFSSAFGGVHLNWLFPYLRSMRFVSHKFAL